MEDKYNIGNIIIYNNHYAFIFHKNNNKTIDLFSNKQIILNEKIGNNMKLNNEDNTFRLKAFLKSIETYLETNESDEAKKLRKVYGDEFDKSNNLKNNDEILSKNSTNSSKPISNI